MKFSKSLFIFHRDLRIDDNKGLINAIDHSNEVLPLFIFDSKFDKIRRDSPKRWEFILESLEDLNSQLNERDSYLHIIQGDFLESLQSLLHEYQYEAIFYNEDYTLLSINRITLVNDFAKKHHLVCFSSIDYPLVDPRMVKTKNNKPFKVFTPFYNRSKLIEVDIPTQIPDTFPFNKLSLPMINPITNFLNIKDWKKDIPIGGRKIALEKLAYVVNLTNYLEERDFPSMNTTSQLSPYIRFGNLSIREVYHFIGSQLKNPEGLIRQLYWRDFYTYIGFHFPHVYQTNYNQKYDFLFWENNDKFFDAWMKGKTGFPIVDAGMRELNQTGSMHNRVRMVVASFLVKDLLIDWKWGERYFAKRLIDYDPAVNNGSWQWVSSTGTDAQPYFRIFNPWRQQKRFDANCEYIKKWVPELRNLESKTIHNLFKKHPETIDYPKNIVNHSERAEMAKLMFKK